MNPIAIFIVSCLFIAFILIMYILSEANITKSSYGIRRLATQKAYDNARYVEWLVRKEPELEVLYGDESCGEMDLSFEDFCMAIYTGKEITYEDMNELTLQDFIGIVLIVVVIAWLITKAILVW